MLNIDKYIEYWRKGVTDAFQTANDLFEKRHFGFALFAAQLTLEQVIKAVVCRATGEVPPKIHNLRRLLELAEVSSDVSTFRQIVEPTIMENKI